MVANGNGTHDENDGDADDGADTSFDAEGIKREKGETAHHAGQGVDFLAENKGYFVDQHIAHHTAGCTGDRAHDQGDPPGMSQRECLFQTNDREDRQTDRVEDEPGDLFRDDLPPENPDGDEGDKRTDHIAGFREPERRHGEHDIADGPTTQCGDESDDIGAEKIEALDRGQSDAGNRRSERAHILQNDEQWIGAAEELPEVEIPVDEGLRSLVSFSCRKADTIIS